MKKIILALGLFTLIMVSCKKEETTTTNNNNTGGGTNTATEWYSFKANGVLFEMKSFTAGKDDSITPGLLFLAGTKVFGQTKPGFNISINRPSMGWGDGTNFLLDETEQFNWAEFTDAEGYIYKSRATPKGAGNGLTLTFTKMPMNPRGTLEGTFSGILKLEENVNTIEITEGKFKITSVN
ncbi:MAG: hypothetical protein ACOVP1_00855 [Bacteroidia bacterium]